MRPLFLTACCALFVGCQSLHPPLPMAIEVRDAETKAPLANAHVSVWHDSLHAVASSGMTGANGAATVLTPPADDTPLIYKVMAKGYLARQDDMPVIHTSTGVMLEVFAEPRPYVELVIPTGYKGVIRGAYRVATEAPFALHQRQFTFTLPTTGATDIIVPPIFPRGVMPDIRCRYADGIPLSRTAKDNELGCRWLEADADSGYLFVIGTQYEADQVRREIKGRKGSAPTVAGPSVMDFGRK